MLHLYLFLGNNDYSNAPQYYVILLILRVLFIYLLIFSDRLVRSRMILMRDIFKNVYC